MGCRADCTWSYSGCVGCGNWQVDPSLGEQCDGSDLGTPPAQCDQPGETGGTLGCHPPGHAQQCRLDRSTCWRCGDGDKDPTEECDDGNTVPGDGCDASCFDECGNGILQVDEECDDGNTVFGDGCSEDCYFSTYYLGGSDPTECNIKWGVTGIAPGPTMRCTQGTACDLDADSTRCTFGLGYCLSTMWGGANACSPTAIDRLFVAAETTLDASETSALLDSFATRLQSIGVAFTRSDPVLDLTTPATPSGLCGSALVRVAQGETRRLALDVVDVQGAVDHDVIDFDCAN